MLGPKHQVSDLCLLLCLGLYDKCHLFFTWAQIPQAERSLYQILASNHASDWSKSNCGWWCLVGGNGGVVPKLCSPFPPLCHLEIQRKCCNFAPPLCKELVKMPAQRRRWHLVTDCNTAPPAKSKMAARRPKNRKHVFQRSRQLSLNKLIDLSTKI